MRYADAIAAAIAAERDVVAFLENESATNNPAPPGSSCDVSGNHRRNDGILRVFRLGGGELTGSVSPPRAVDAAPLVNGRPLAISDGLVFFRTREAALATNTLVQASVKTGGGQANTTNGGGTFVSAISNDGRFVAFSDRRSDLEAPDVSSWHGMMTSVVACGNGWLSEGLYRGLASEASLVLVKVGSAALGGQGGGGRPDMAQAGGPDATRAKDALAAIESAIGTGAKAAE